MCLAVPMKLIQVKDASTGIAAMDGVTYDVNLSLLAEPEVGDYVIVHAGFAIERLDREEADARIELFQQLAASQQNGPADHSA